MIGENNISNKSEDVAVISSSLKHERTLSLGSVSILSTTQFDNKLIFVRDPVLVGGVVPPFIIYKVHSHTLKQTESVVERRYSDFVWLSNKLILECPHCIIPSLPPKQVIGSYDEAFIELRRKALERFLNRIAQHPHLTQSSYFAIFLRATDQELVEARHEVSSSSSGINTAAANMQTSWFDSTMNKLIKSAKAFTNDLSFPTDEEDEKQDVFDSALNEALVKEDMFQTVAFKAQAVLTKAKDICELQSKLGQSLNMLSQKEEDADLRVFLMDIGAMMTSLGSAKSAAVKIDSDLFEAALDETSGFATAVKEAFQRRREAKQEHEDAVRYVVRCRSALQEVDIYGMWYADDFQAVVDAKRRDLAHARLIEQSTREQLERLSVGLVENYNCSKVVNVKDTHDALLTYARCKVESSIKVKTILEGLLKKHQPQSGAAGN